MNTDTNYKHILVAIDFSTCAKAALRQAVWFARNSGSKLTLIYAAPDYKRFSQIASEIRQESELKMRQLLMDYWHSCSAALVSHSLPIALTNPFKRRIETGIPLCTKQPRDDERHRT